MDDSGIICGKIIESFDEETKTIPTNFNEKRGTCKMQNFYIFTSVCINYYIIIDSCVSIYCYLIRYWAKQKHLLLFHST